ncbi:MULTISPECIES: hypothetical protein [Thermocrispum]|nr:MULTISPECIES: hypothetical protein [Thermocrispum]
MTDLTPAVGTDGMVDWIQQALVEKYDVRSLVPEVFEDYARLFHPAMDIEGRPVSWSAVAQWSGRVMHARAQWAAIANPVDPELPPPFTEEPETGSITRPMASRLAKLLKPFTTNPGRCWFAVWDGGDFRPEWSRGARFTLPLDRELILLTGSLDAVTTSMRDDTHDGHYQSPYAWWPDCRSWCVATDIDLAVTHVGGSRACIDAILADSELEAFRVPSTSPVTYDSDDKNPLPSGDDAVVSAGSSWKDRWRKLRGR